MNILNTIYITYSQALKQCKKTPLQKKRGVFRHYVFEHQKKEYQPYDLMLPHQMEKYNTYVLYISNETIVLVIIC